ncbi:hypothetical protein L6R53_15395 [Myxococcota bacterium]|nr:hypothetical protein [Myxococcota bacterium]
MPVLLLLVGLALAQAPASSPAAPPASATAELVTPTWWLSREAPLARWAGQAPVVATLPAGTEVTLVLRDGDQARVRHGLDFGWVPADALSDAPPADAVPPAAP